MESVLLFWAKLNIVYEVKVKTRFLLCSCRSNDRLMFDVTVDINLHLYLSFVAHSNCATVEENPIITI